MAGLASDRLWRADSCALVSARQPPRPVAGDSLPGGGAEFGPQPVEVIFYVLDGVISVETDSGDITLEPGQAVHIHKGENKGVHNRTNAPASMLVIAKVPDEMAH